MSGPRAGTPERDAMLRRLMMAALSAPRAIGLVQSTHDDNVAFCEAFIRASRPRPCPGAAVDVAQKELDL